MAMFAGAPFFAASGAAPSAAMGLVRERPCEWLTEPGASTHDPKRARLFGGFEAASAQHGGYNQCGAAGLMQAPPAASQPTLMPQQQQQRPAETFLVFAFNED
eukprot:TRINITY_DN43628_c0_g1_i1.p2 TRINITY_DN43628_c0_g1~~TRINITY_DN43628_c0_g1_i1.p2  ORF type:complete len:120 (-),score=32.88 TRINITY_DN43628_c0_g1_i1:106-414(-)